MAKDMWETGTRSNTGTDNQSHMTLRTPLAYYICELVVGGLKVGFCIALLVGRAETEAGEKPISVSRWGTEMLRASCLCLAFKSLKSSM